MENFEIMDKEISGRPTGGSGSAKRETISRQLVNMGKCFISNRWLPQALTDAQKQKRMDVCTSILQMNSRNSFLLRFITGDETWIYWENARTGSRRSWRGIDDEPPADVRRTLITKTHFATVFWDQKV